MEEFVITRGRRGVTGAWALVLSGVVAVSTVSLVIAISRPARDGSGGAGHLIGPFFGAVVSLLLLVLAAVQWWEDATYFRLTPAGLTIRRGTRRLRGRAIVFRQLQAVTYTEEGGRDTGRAFVEQDGTRVNLGKTEEIRPQLPRWEAWMHSAGLVVDRRRGTRDR